MMESKAATGRLNRWAACRYISTSIVDMAGPPNIRIMPKLEKQKINTRAHAARMAGFSSGRLI